MTQIGTRFPSMTLVIGLLAQIGLPSCSSSVASQVDEQIDDGGGRDGALQGAGGTGGAGTGGAQATGGSFGWECLGGGRYCRLGVVYEGYYGYSLDGTCSRPVDTCPYGCNSNWNWRDAGSLICNPPPPGCTDAGQCADSGTVPDTDAAPDAEPTDAGAADSTPG